MLSWRHTVLTIDRHIIPPQYSIAKPSSRLPFIIFERIHQCDNYQSKVKHEHWSINFGEFAFGMLVFCNRHFQWPNVRTFKFKLWVALSIRWTTWKPVLSIEKRDWFFTYKILEADDWELCFWQNFSSSKLDSQIIGWSNWVQKLNINSLAWINWIEQLVELNSEADKSKGRVKQTDTIIRFQVKISTWKLEKQTSLSAASRGRARSLNWRRLRRSSSSIAVSRWRMQFSTSATS